MPPQQSPGYTPAPSPNLQPAPQHDPYDFIVNYDQRTGKRSPISGNRSTTNRALIAIVGAIFLIVVIWIFLTILSNSSTINTTAAIGIAQRQTELARISKDPIDQAAAQPTKDFAATTQFTLLSEQQILVNFLQLHGAKVNTTVLGADENKQSDSELLTAKANGDYDQTYITIAQSQLTSYELALKQAYTGSKNATERKLLSQDFNAAQLLLKFSTQTE